MSQVSLIKMETVLINIRIKLTIIRILKLVLWAEPLIRVVTVALNIHLQNHQWIIRPSHRIPSSH